MCRDSLGVNSVFLEVIKKFGICLYFSLISCGMINNAEIISSAKVTCIAAISDKNSRCIYAVLWSTLACCSNWIVPAGLFHFLLESANEQEKS